MKKVPTRGSFQASILTSDLQPLDGFLLKSGQSPISQTLRTKVETSKEMAQPVQDLLSLEMEEPPGVSPTLYARTRCASPTWSKMSAVSFLISEE